MQSSGSYKNRNIYQFLVIPGISGRPIVKNRQGRTMEYLAKG